MKKKITCSYMTGKNIKNRVTILSSRGDEILSL